MKRLALFVVCFLVAGCLGVDDYYYDDVVYCGPVVKDACCNSSSWHRPPLRATETSAMIQQAGHQASPQTREPELLQLAK